MVKRQRGGDRMEGGEMKERWKRQKEREEEVRESQIGQWSSHHCYTATPKLPISSMYAHRQQ